MLALRALHGVRAMPPVEMYWECRSILMNRTDLTLANYSGRRHAGDLDTPKLVLGLIHPDGKAHDMARDCQGSDTAAIVLAGDSVHPGNPRYGVRPPFHPDYLGVTRTLQALDTPPARV